MPGTTAHEKRVVDAGESAKGSVAGRGALADPQPPTLQSRTRAVMNLFKRDAVSRAGLFLEMARMCTVEQRDEYEAFLEAAIVFGRSALLRLKTTFRKHGNWPEWWESLRGDESVEFLREERNYVLKEGPTKVGQVIRIGVRTELAEEHYYFESPDVPATATVEKHLKRVEQLVVEAEQRFAVKSGPERR
jgi:hypothetical protein